MKEKMKKVFVEQMESVGAFTQVMVASSMEEVEGMGPFGEGGGSDGDSEKLKALIEELNEQDDVQEVYVNAE